MIRSRHRLALLGVLLAGPAAAFDLTFPVACTLGEDCYLQNLFDHDLVPRPGMRPAGL